MSVLVPAAPEHLQLEELRAAHELLMPLQWLDHRHIAVHDHAQVLSVIGLTGENVVVGLALGNLTDDQPHTYLLAREPRDPALAVLAGAELADLLEPLLERHLNGQPVQVLVDSDGTCESLRSWTARLRSPWTPGPYARDTRIAAAADRSRDGHALLSSVLTAAEVPGADVVCAAVPALVDHFTFPLAGQLEAQQLPVLLTCLRRAGAPVTALPPARGTLAEDIEVAEDTTVSSATRPEWDNETLLPALAGFKRRRNTAAGGDQLRRVDQQVVAEAGAASGLDTVVRAALTERHQAIAEAFRILRMLPPLPGLDDRRLRAAFWVDPTLRRGLAHDPRWPDFPNLSTAGRHAERDDRLVLHATLEATRGDDRAFAFLAAAGKAVQPELSAPPSSDGRTVTLTLPPGTPTPHQPDDWWWLDDPTDGDFSAAPLTGILEATGPATATWHVTSGASRIVDGALHAVDRRPLRLVCLDRPFRGRPWRPPENTPVVAV